MQFEPNSVRRAEIERTHVLNSVPAYFPPPLVARQFSGKLHMERAARLIKNDKYSKRIIEDDAIVQAVWPAAVGKAIARHTGNLKIVRECLVVEVEDALWQKQLHSLRNQIVDRVQKLTGNAAIQRVEFRVGIPKRAPQRTEIAHSRPVLQGTEPDEADQIQDPVLKKVYRLSRKRATA